MITTSARLLRLLSLLQARKLWSGAELADRLEVTTRSLRRDIDRLRELGYPVESERGVGGGYRLGAGRELPPLLLDDEEAITVAVALQAAAADPVADDGETALRALGKLEQVLPSRLRRQVSALTASIVHTRRRARDPIQPAILATLARCCRDEERLRFGYVAADDRRSRRHVEPYRLVSTGRRWYFVADDLDRGEWRTFRVDRIRSPEPTGAIFSRTEHPDAAELVARSVGTMPYPCVARLLLHLSQQQAQELLPATAGLIEAETDQTCVLTAGSTGWTNIAIYLLGSGIGFTVLGPQEMRDEVSRLADQLRRSARSST